MKIFLSFRLAHVSGLLPATFVTPCEPHTWFAFLFSCFCTCNLYLPPPPPLYFSCFNRFQVQAVFCLLTRYFSLCLFSCGIFIALARWVRLPSNFYRTILSFFQIVLCFWFRSVFSFLNLELFVTVPLFKSSLKKDRAILSETSGQRKLVCWCWGRAKRLTWPSKNPKNHSFQKHFFTRKVLPQAQFWTKKKKIYKRRYGWHKDVLLTSNVLTINAFVSEIVPWNLNSSWPLQFWTVQLTCLTSLITLHVPQSGDVSPHHSQCVNVHRFACSHPDCPRVTV